MIRLSSSTVMVLRRDSSLEPLDPESICSRIVRACFAASENNTWIGAEIARSVEFALLSREKRVITPMELDDMIVRSLEDSGYPRVAEEFGKRPFSPDHDAVSADESVIAEVLTSHLASSPEQCRFLARQVKKALDVLGLPRASIRLVQELAREYRDTASEQFPVQEKTIPRKNEPFLLLPDDGRILEQLPPEGQEFYAEKVLSFDGISSLFPGLHFRLSLAAFADLLDLELPVSELAFWNVSARLAAVMDQTAELAFRQLPKEIFTGEGTSLPVSIEVTDVLAFGVQYMQCPARDAADCVQLLMDTFAEKLTHTPFKIHCEPKKN